MLRIASRIVWPVETAPILHGAVLVDDGGRIVEVGPDTRVPNPPDVTRLSFQNAVVMPGLVNTHTHLELSGLRGAVTETDFAQWIGRVRVLKEATDADAHREAARAGLREAWRTGTTTVADTGTTGAAVHALRELGGRGIYYQEAIAPEPGRAVQALGELVRAVDHLASVASAEVALGVSPHAPYTVSPELYREVAAWARSEGLSLAAHVAESSAETDLLTEARGPFAEMWMRRGIPLPEPSRSAVAYLDGLDLLGPDLLAIHLVQADERDIGLLAERGVAVASCPRSNERHGHGAPPLRELLDAGVRVGLGTDSLASVASLDLFAEARAAVRAASIEPEAAVRLVTADAARALGREDSIGGIAAGRWADLCVVEVPPLIAADAPAVARAVLESGAGGVVATYVAGREVFAR